MRSARSLSEVEIRYKTSWLYRSIVKRVPIIDFRSTSLANFPANHEHGSG